MAEATSALLPPGLVVHLACDLEKVRDAADAARRFLTEQGCWAADVLDCELALVEACNNAIQYASPENREKPVMVEVSCAPSAIELRVSDHTPGFDWPEQVSLPDADREHGRGLYLIQSVMDSVQYLRSPGKNTLVLRRRRTA
jgi:anti-sigma regulatory factor (Ser/Thr protein kinase)